MLSRKNKRHSSMNSLNSLASIKEYKVQKHGQIKKKTLED